MENNRLTQLRRLGFDRWYILYKYSGLDHVLLVDEVTADYLCLKEYLEYNENFYAEDAKEFLQKFLFYIKGNGMIFPANFYDEDRGGTLLSAEMHRIYCEVRNK